MLKEKPIKLECHTFLLYLNKLMHLFFASWASWLWKLILCIFGATGTIWESMWSLAILKLSYTFQCLWVCWIFLGIIDLSVVEYQWTDQALWCVDTRQFQVEPCRDLIFVSRPRILPLSMAFLTINFITLQFLDVTTFPSSGTVDESP